MEYEKLKRNFVTAEEEITKKEFQPASFLRRSFTIEEEIKKAILYTTACGLYKGYLNGDPLTINCFYRVLPITKNAYSFKPLRSLLYLFHCIRLVLNLISKKEDFF